MTYQNKHTARFIEVQEKIRTSDPDFWVINTSHDDFIRECSTTIFTNLNQKICRGYKKTYTCEDCGGVPEDGCHGIGEDRPILLRRALEKIWPDTSKKANMKDIKIAYLEEHKSTRYALKCKACHRAEGKVKVKGTTSSHTEFVPEQDSLTQD